MLHQESVTDAENALSANSAIMTILTNALGSVVGKRNSNSKMISDTNRAYWFGASDTKMVMADNRDTVTWRNFWDEKCGRFENDNGNLATFTGTKFEHPIIEAVDGEINKDRQILLEDMRLRVNYDGDKNGIIYEVKTHRYDKPFLTKNVEYQFLPKYIYGQVQVQMYAWKLAHERDMDVPEFKKLYVVEYPLYEDDYTREDPEVEFKRIKFHKVKYDKGFIKQYKKKLFPLVEMLVSEIGDEKIK